jgi:predicted TIM-barrel fold metal-dependent hydrolase
MSKVIDLDLPIPPSAEQIASTIKLWALGRGAKGLANYRHIFGPSKAREFGMSIEELEQLSRELSPEAFDAMLLEQAQRLVMSLAEFVTQMDDADIAWGAFRTDSNDRTAEVVAQYPGRFLGQALANPHEGMQAVRELERAVKELGLRSFYASPFRYGLPPNHKKFYPLYAKAAELHIPVFVYVTMNYNTALPMDLSHPRHLDEVAIDFPELPLIAGCGGWPWVPEMVGVARRHQNVYIDTEAHRPKHLATPGSGWEMLLQFGNTLLQDRVLFASNWASYFQPSADVLHRIIAEMRALPLKEAVKEKWLYHNAARLFNRE